MDDGMRPISSIVVMADGACTYAWSESAECIGRGDLRMIAQCLLEYRGLSDLVDLEYEFWSWAATVHSANALSAAQWREFHVEGLILARRLADLMRDLGIPVFYRSGPISVHQHFDVGPL